MSISLNQVRVQNPCPADWNAMDGDDRKRFCKTCNRQVHDLTNLGKSDAEKLINEQFESLCVRYQADTSGAPIALNYRPVTRKSRSWIWIVLTGVFAGVASMLAMMWTKQVLFFRPTMIQGKIAPPYATPVVQGQPRILQGDMNPVEASTQPSIKQGIVYRPEKTRSAE